MSQPGFPCFPQLPGCLGCCRAWFVSDTTTRAWLSVGCNTAWWKTSCITVWILH